MNGTLKKRLAARDRMKCVRVGRRLVAILRVTQFPSQLPRDWLSSLLVSLPFLASSVSLYPISKNTSTSTVGRFILNLSSEVIYRSQYGRPCDDIERLLERARVLSEDIRSDATRLFYASVLLAVTADSLMTLKEELEMTESMLRSDGVSYSSLECSQRSTLGELSLYHRSAFEESPIVSMQSLPALIPFTQSAILQRGGSYLGFNALDGSPVVFDRFSGLNFNSIVVGKSGSGKSFFAKVTILREIGREGRCYVIDPLGEFLGPCLHAAGFPVDVLNEGLGLGSLTLSQLSPIQHHFFAFLGSALRLSESELDGLRRTVSSRMRINPGERVRAMLDELGFFSELSSNGVQPGERTSGAGFAVRGEYPIRERSKLTVFDLSAVSRDILSDTISLISGMVFEHCKTTPGRKTLVVDEAWNVSRKRETALSLSEITRHSRHFDLSVVLISQNFDDFLGEYYGESLLNNCNNYFLFRHEKVSSQMLSRLELGDQDLAFLSASTPRLSGTGRCVLISAGRKIPLILPSDETEREICRTDGGQIGSPHLFLSLLAECRLSETAALLGMV